MALDPIAGGAWYKRYSIGNRSILEDVPVSPTPAKPEYLYAWANSNGETLYAWQSHYNPDLGDTLYYMDSNNNAVYIPYNTIYTKTSVIDTSTSVYYLSDGTELPLHNLYEATYNADHIESADTNQISIRFED